MSLHLLGKTFVAVLLLVSFPMSPAEAVNRVWNSSTNNFWTVGPWLPDGVPTSADSVTFNVPATYQVLFDQGTGDMTVNDLFVTGGDVTFRVFNGPSRSVYLNGTGGSNDVNIGPGKLTLGVGGAIILDMVDEVRILDGGTLNIENGSMIVDSNYLYVGFGGAGTLNIANGGIVASIIGVVGYNSGSASIVNVASSTLWNDLLFVGGLGEGTLNITNGADVRSNHALIGSGPGSTGTVTVNNAEWDSGNNLDVGGYGDAVLNITGGGHVFSIRGTLGARSGTTGAVTVDGAGSSLYIYHPLFVGRSGDGTLEITNGGQVDSAGGTIGTDSGSTSAVTVDGGGSFWNALLVNGTSLEVGSSGDGTLEITNGGQVDSRGGVIGVNSGSTGAVTVAGAGSSWTNDSALTVGGLGTGMLGVTNGGRVYVGDIDPLSSGLPANQSAIVVSDASSVADEGKLQVGGGSSLSTNGEVYIALLANHSGKVTVQGTDAQVISGGAFHVGKRGIGTLEIAAGGQVFSSEGNIGTDLGSTGTVTVNNSTWFSNGLLTVGDYGHGALEISNGGQVIAYVAYIGNNSDGTGDVSVDGVGSAWISHGILNVGNSGEGALEITGGGLVTNTGVGSIGYNSGSNGIVNVDGPGSMWTTGNSVVGRSGDGTLNITNGGQVSCFGGNIGSLPGSNGTVTVNNATWTTTGGLTVGNQGEGSLHVINAGQVSTTISVIGDYFGSIGQATVDGSGSLWTNDNILVVGLYGDGKLEVTNGGQVTSAGGSIGLHFGSAGAAIVDGPGSSWTNIATLTVGDHGDGSLNVINGGQVANTSASIGGFVDSTSQVTVDGPGSSWTNTGTLFVGRFASEGSLDITNSGQVFSFDGSIGTDPGSTGTVTVDNSTWTNSGSITVGNSGDGSLLVTNGGQVSVGDTLTIGAFGQLIGDGTVVADIVINNGIVVPGNSPGTLRINGGYTQDAGGTLKIELSSLTNFDKLIVNGAATLGGTLDVILLGDFQPSLGMSFDILDWPNRNGTFATLNLPDLPGSLDWNISQLYTAGLLSVIASLPGDYNANGIVDAADYVVWRKGIGIASTETNYNLWRAHFGETLDNGSGATANVTVPEPATLVLLIVAPAGVCPLRRRIAS